MLCRLVSEGNNVPEPTGEPSALSGMQKPVLQPVSSKSTTRSAQGSSACAKPAMPIASRQSQSGHVLPFIMSPSK